LNQQVTGVAAIQRFNRLDREIAQLHEEVGEEMPGHGAPDAVRPLDNQGKGNASSKVIRVTVK